ncbi:hypothetical protein Rs2_40978 [Raphanus sativus]|nr:hypothetical protein Rs2_40978 [Raphanus sativus]
MNGDDIVEASLALDWKLSQACQVTKRHLKELMRLRTAIKNKDRGLMSKKPPLISTIMSEYTLTQLVMSIVINGKWIDFEDLKMQAFQANILKVLRCQQEPFNLFVPSYITLQQTPRCSRHH